MENPESTEAAILLVDKGANVNAQTEYGLTPLILAVGYVQTDIVKLLLSHGANTKLKDKWGGDVRKAAQKRFANDATREIEAMVIKADEGK